MAKRRAQVSRDDDALQSRVERVIGSFDLLFREPRDGRLVVRAVAHREMVETYARLLGSIQRELAGERPAAGQADAIDYLNQLTRLAATRPLAERLGEALCDALLDWLPTDAHADADRLGFAAEHARRLVGQGLAVVTDYIKQVRSADPAASDRIIPGALGEFPPQLAWLADKKKLNAAALDRLLRVIHEQDQFATHRTYRAIGGQIMPDAIGDIRPLDRLFGYVNEKHFLEAHFSAFAEGRSVPPLLLYGLPGLGKTHFTIAYTLAYELVLVGADQDHLGQPLHDLLAVLGRHRHRRFVLFFDDIDAEAADWSHFRHHVSGYLPYPGNVSMVIASNVPFPANVRSRCTSFEFRPMDPVVTTEIIEDYLRKQVGMQNPSRRLAGVVAADFVNEYVNGPLPELTPRSLIRYLEMFERDDNRRLALLTESLQPAARMPTVEPFMESNRKLLEEMNRDRQRYQWKPQQFME